MTYEFVWNYLHALATSLGITLIVSAVPAMPSMNGIIGLIIGIGVTTVSLGGIVTTITMKMEKET